MLEQTYSLLVYFECPETTRLFLIPNNQIPEDLKKDLELVHGYMMNHVNCQNYTDKEIAMWHVTDAISTAFYNYDYPYCEWLKQFELENLIEHARNMKPIQANITNVYHCGWIL